MFRRSKKAEAGIVDADAGAAFITAAAPEEAAAPAESLNLELKEGATDAEEPEAPMLKNSSSFMQKLAASPKALGSGMVSGVKGIGSGVTFVTKGTLDLNAKLFDGVTGAGARVGKGVTKGLGSGVTALGSGIARVVPGRDGGVTLVVYPDINANFSLRCANLPIMDVDSASDPIVIMYTKDDAGEWSESGRTEVIWNNLNPVFNTKLLVRCPSSNGLLVRFDVYDIDEDKTAVLVTDLELKNSDMCGCTSMIPLNKVLTSTEHENELELPLSGAGCETQGIVDASLTVSSKVDLAGPRVAAEEVVFVHEHEFEAKKKAEEDANKKKGVVGKVGGGIVGGIGKMGGGIGKVGGGVVGGIGKMGGGLGKMGGGLGKMGGAISPFGRKKKAAAAAAAEAEAEAEAAPEPEPEPEAETAEPEAEVKAGAEADVGVEETEAGAAPEAENEAGAPTVDPGVPEGFVKVVITLPCDVKPNQRIVVPCGWTTHNTRIAPNAAPEACVAGTEYTLLVPDATDEVAAADAGEAAAEAADALAADGEAPQKSRKSFLSRIGLSNSNSQTQEELESLVAEAEEASGEADGLDAVTVEEEAAPVLNVDKKKSFTSRLSLRGSKKAAADVPTEAVDVPAETPAEEAPPAAAVEPVAEPDVATPADSGKKKSRFGMRNPLAKKNTGAQAEAQAETEAEPAPEPEPEPTQSPSKGGMMGKLGKGFGGLSPRKSKKSAEPAQPEVAAAVEAAPEAAPAVASEASATVEDAAPEGPAEGDAASEEEAGGKKRSKSVFGFGKKESKDASS